MRSTPSPSNRKMFVYGTLRRDMKYPLLTPYEGVSEGYGTIQGTMYTFGGFPGVLRDDSDRVVNGQLLSYDHLTQDQWDKTIEVVDAYEGSGFSRHEVPITMHNGSTELAWTYFPHEECITPYLQIIHSGDWRQWRVGV